MEDAAELLMLALMVFPYNIIPHRGSVPHSSFRPIAALVSILISRSGVFKSSVIVMVTKWIFHYLSKLSKDTKTRHGRRERDAVAFVPLTVGNGAYLSLRGANRQDARTIMHGDCCCWDTNNNASIRG